MLAHLIDFVFRGQTPTPSDNVMIDENVAEVAEQVDLRTIIIISTTKWNYTLQLVRHWIVINESRQDDDYQGR